MVAQRLLRNSSIRPVQRFDSADYFLNLHIEQQRRLSNEASQQASTQASRDPSPPPRSSPDLLCNETMADAEGGLEQALRPPALGRAGRPPSPCFGEGGA